MTTSDNAESLAGQLATQVFSPRVADLVALAIRYCALEGCPLDDDQSIAIFRATIDASDGIERQTALLIDDHARRLLSQPSGPLRRRLRVHDAEGER